MTSTHNGKSSQHCVVLFETTNTQLVDQLNSSLCHLISKSLDNLDITPALKGLQQINIVSNYKLKHTSSSIAQIWVAIHIHELGPAINTIEWSDLVIHTEKRSSQKHAIEICAKSLSEELITLMPTDISTFGVSAVSMALIADIWKQLVSDCNTDFIGTLWMPVAQPHFSGKS